MGVAVARRDWKTCVQLTRDALADGLVVRWHLTREVCADYAAWMAADPPSWQVSDKHVVRWEVWTVPSPAYRFGNDWRGGVSAQRNAGGYADIDEATAKKFHQAILTLTK